MSNQGASSSESFDNYYSEVSLSDRNAIFVCNLTRRIRRFENDGLSQNDFFRLNRLSKSRPEIQCSHRNNK